MESYIRILEQSLLLEESGIFTRENAAINSVSSWQLGPLLNVELNVESTQQNSFLLLQEVENREM